MKLSDTQPQNSPVTISQLPNTNLNTQDLYALGNGQASQLQNVKIKFFDQQNKPQNANKFDMFLSVIYLNKNYIIKFSIFFYFQIELLCDAI